MTRRLPPVPSLEHLRKQAKELLRELRRQRPQSKLADAQHAIAVEYGCRNWPALKARVEAVGGDTAFAGTWRMNPAKSRQPAGDSLVPTLHISVAADIVTITDVRVDASAREERVVNTIRADGGAHAVEHGYVMTAAWRGARMLETAVEKDGQHVSRIVYELSVDGQTLTIAGSAAAHDGYPATEHFSVFDRVSQLFS